MDTIIVVIVSVVIKMLRTSVHLLRRLRFLLPRRSFLGVDRSK